MHCFPCTSNLCLSISAKPAWSKQVYGGTALLSERHGKAEHWQCKLWICSCMHTPRWDCLEPCSIWLLSSCLSHSPGKDLEGEGNVGEGRTGNLLRLVRGGHFISISSNCEETQYLYRRGCQFNWWLFEAKVSPFFSSDFCITNKNNKQNYTIVPLKVCICSPYYFFLLNCIYSKQCYMIHPGIYWRERRKGSEQLWCQN